MSLATVEHVDREAVLRTLNLDPRNPQTQALLLICARYDLDPLMKHVVLIKGRSYVTRDGYLHIAHLSGQFDGIEIVEEGETDDGWWARASVYRKDMGRPFTYKGRYPRTGNEDHDRYGPEMAVKTAEIHALRRAFNVTGLAADEQCDMGEEPYPQAEIEPPPIPSKNAKVELLEAADGDKAAATAAWENAGLKGRRTVTPDELDQAINLLPAPDGDGQPALPPDEAA